MSTIERFASDILLPDLLPIKNTFPAGIKEYIGEPSRHTLLNLGDAIRSIGNINNKSLTNYLNISYILLLEQEKYLNDQYHEYYIHLLNELCKIGPLDKSKLVLQTANASISRATNPPMTLENLILEFSFLAKLKTEGLDVSDQLGSIEALAKTKIFSSLSSLEDIESALAKLEKAHQSGMALISTKKTLLVIIATFYEPIPANKLRRFKERLINMNTPYNGELDQYSQPDQDNRDDSGLMKKRVVHMNNENDPSISVWECTRIGIPGRIALKEMASYDIAKLQSFKLEADILQRLSNTGHKFCIKFYGSTLTIERENNRDKHILRMEMEFIESSLNQHRANRKSCNTGYSESEIANIFMQILDGFNLLNQMKILHNDIKPSNLMITDDFIIKVIDFNISRELKETTLYGQAAQGSLNFMAPEVRVAYDAKQTVALKSDKSDIFSLGLTLLSLVVLSEPLEDLNLKKNEGKLISLINSVKYEWLKEYLKKMLVFDPNKRAALKDLCTAPVENPTNFN